MGASSPSDGVGTGAVSQALVTVGAADTPVFVVCLDGEKKNTEFQAAHGKDGPATNGVPEVECIENEHLDEKENDEAQGYPVVSLLVGRTAQ